MNWLRSKNAASAITTNSIWHGQKHSNGSNPLRLSLRKADIKHKRFDIMMLVDDNELQKKGVNLYETLLLNLADRPQPLEVVVNKIPKKPLWAT
jgi:hypothetical protein